jgi:hypothetical protein
MSWYTKPFDYLDNNEILLLSAAAFYITTSEFHLRGWTTSFFAAVLICFLGATAVALLFLQKVPGVQNSFFPPCYFRYSFAF